MSQIVAQFDPANPAAAFATSFNTLFPNKVGKIVVYNRSLIDLQLQWAGNTDFAPAQTASLFCISNPTTNISWSGLTTLTLLNPGASQVTIVSFGPNEPIMGTFPMPLASSLNSGNAIGHQSLLQVASWLDVNNQTIAVIPALAGLVGYLKKFTVTVKKGTAASGTLQIQGLTLNGGDGSGIAWYQLSTQPNGVPPFVEEFEQPLPSLATDTNVFFEFPNISGVDGMSLVATYFYQ